MAASPAFADDGAQQHELQRLRAELERMAEFARASGDWLWETDAALVLRWVSDSFTPATGLTAAAVLGSRLAEAVLLDSGADNAARFAELVHRRAPFSRLVTLLQVPQGALKVSHSAVPYLDAGGQFAGYRGTARDVTAQVDAQAQARAQSVLLRLSEERWELAASATGIGIAELDVASGRLLLDERARINHGLPGPQREWTVAAWASTIHPADHDRVLAALRDAIDQCGRFDARFRLCVDGGEGSERVLEVVARASRGLDGRTQNLVGTCRDVTQQVAHEQLLRDKEAAVRASRAKTEFLSRMSHELRTPLNGILGFTQLMALDRVHPLAPDQQRRLDSVHRAGRHLLGLINDVLDLARIESEDFSLRLEPVNLSLALDACLTLIAPLAHDTRVVLPAPPAAPCWVQADRRGLDQVLMNLLSNAIKYNRPGGRVRVALRSDAAQVHLAISDEGAGLSAAQQARLFQHFDRLGAEAGRIEGTGLGLVISLELARAMGAELSVQSQPGVGSTFTLALPQASAPPAEPAPSAAESPAPGSDSGPQRSVLYIEDERLNVVLMEEVFRTRPEWALAIAEDGAEGLKLARELRPHLVLVDMNLPDTTGLALIRTLRADPDTQPLRCIALSADAMREQIEAALAAGFDEYWTKPIDLHRMLKDLAQRLA